MDSLQTVEAVAYRRLRGRILSGDLRPGTPLRQIPLARELGASRTPVHHAIRQLVRDGLAVHTPGLGAVVKKHDDREIKDLMELRAVVERGAAVLAAQRITDEELAELRRLCEQMRRYAREARGVRDAQAMSRLIESNAQVDAKIHELIVRASRNEQLLKLVRNVDLISRVCSCFYPKAPKHPVQYLAHNYRKHLRLYRAIRTRNPMKAAAEMEEHLRVATVLVLEALQELSSRETENQDFTPVEGGEER